MRLSVCAPLLVASRRPDELACPKAMIPPKVSRAAKQREVGLSNIAFAFNISRRCVAGASRLRVERGSGEASLSRVLTEASESAILPSIGDGRKSKQRRASSGNTRPADSSFALNRENARLWDRRAAEASLRRCSGGG